MKSIRNQCDSRSQLLTEPNAPIKNPNEVDRLRGFQLIGLTDEGAVPSFDVIRARSASQRKNNAFCHASIDVRNITLGHHPDDETLLQDYAQHLVYDLVYDTFFTGTSNYLGSS
jgi:hypothetical protein